MVCRPRRSTVLAGLSLPLLVHLLFLFFELVSYTSAQATTTSASLNDPSSATGTPSSKGNSTNSTTSSPTSTSVVAVPLSAQQVPYLLGIPKSSDKSYIQRGPYFTGCSDSSSVGYVASQNRINISSVYTQIDRSQSDSSLGDGTPYSAGTLRIVGIGSVGNESYAFNSYTDSTGVTRGLLSAIQVSTRFSTFPVFSNYTYLCNRLYPTQNDSQHPDVHPPSCQYGPGTISFGVDIPLNSTWEAGALTTEIRITDSSSPALTIACIGVLASPYYPQRSYWKVMMWLPVALAATFFALALGATFVTAETAQRSAYKNRAREGGAPKFVQDKLNPMVISAFSGKGLIMSPSLLRFVTPGCWDIIFHLQFIVAIAMCHVQWPDFAYPFFRQAAWSALLGNVTLTQADHNRYNVLSTNASLPSGDLGSAMSDVTSPLYMNADQNNVLLNLGDSQDGIQTYAHIVGLEPEDLFGTCLTIWLAIVAAVLIASIIIWIIDLAAHAHDQRTTRREEGAVRLPSSPGMGLVDSDEGKGGDKDRSRVSSISTTMTAIRSSPINRTRWRFNMGMHSKALHGNLLRILVLFHLPITIMSTYQFSLPHQHSTISVALAALAFAVFSVLLPVYIIVRIAKTPLQKLFEHVGTLLSLGPVYHNYSPGSQLFYSVSFAHSLILGLAVGVGQGSGAAQAIIILVIEVFAALASSLWLPWGEGGMMGPLSFMSNVLRIITAVLVLLLTTLVGFSYSARTWLTYVVLLIQGIYFFGAILVLLVKLLESFVRLVWRVRFDERMSARTAGLGGAIRKIKRRKLKNRERANSSSVQLQRLKLEHRNSNGSTNTTSIMLANSQQIPMSDSRQGNYSDYLGTGIKRPMSGYMNHYGVIDEENGHIMAALPPVSPAYDGQGDTFVRTGGGRATDVNPYATLPRQNDISPIHNRPRQTSQSGVIGNWGSNDAITKKAIDQKSSYQALARTPSYELSSTQAAALAASKSLQLNQSTNDRSNKKVAGSRGFKWGKSRAIQTEDDDDDEEDEWSDEGMTWDSNAAARNKGAWSGVAKMSAALSGLKRNILGGVTHAQPDHEEDDTEAGTDSLPPSGSGGFQVVRATRPAPTSQPQKDQQHKEEDGQEPASSSSPQRQQGGHQSHQDYTRGPLGMLTADLQRAPSSAGHTEEDRGEDRFWLPPLEIETPTRQGEDAWLGGTVSSK